MESTVYKYSTVWLVRVNTTAYVMHMHLCNLIGAVKLESNPAPVTRKVAQNTRLSYSHADMRTSEHKSKLGWVKM